MIIQVTLSFLPYTQGSRSWKHEVIWYVWLKKVFSKTTKDEIKYGELFNGFGNLSKWECEINVSLGFRCASNKFAKMSRGQKYIWDILKIKVKCDIWMHSFSYLNDGAGRDSCSIPLRSDQKRISYQREMITSRKIPTKFANHASMLNITTFHSSNIWNAETLKWLNQENKNEIIVFGSELSTRKNSHGKKIPYLSLEQFFQPFVFHLTAHFNLYFNFCVTQIMMIKKIKE